MFGVLCRERVFDEKDDRKITSVFGPDYYSFAVTSARGRFYPCIGDDI